MIDPQRTTPRAVEDEFDDDLDTTTLDDLDATETEHRPFERAAWTYLNKGWSPLPMRGPQSKALAVSGVTGRDGRMATAEDVADWMSEHAGHNIGLRLPKNVLGIDVDAYVKDGKQKVGDLTLAAWCSEHGNLPRTYMSTSRTDGVSGIRFFRVPELAEDEEWIANIPGDIEIIQFHHRYIVVSPSVNPLSGMQYEWISPDGEILDADSAPSIEDLPELPEGWVQALKKKVVERKNRGNQTPVAHEPTEIHPRAQEYRQRAIQRLQDCTTKGWEVQWDENCFIAAKELLRVANSNWSGYTVDDAELDISLHAPVDPNWRVENTLVKLHNLQAQGFDEFLPNPEQAPPSPWTPPTVPPATKSARARIQIKQGEFDTLYDETVLSMVGYDLGAPEVFRYGRQLSLVEDESLVPMNKGIMRVENARRVQYFAMERFRTEDGEMEWKEMNKNAPEPLLDSLLSVADTRFPEVKSVYRAPFFSQEGEWVRERGYHAASQAYLATRLRVADVQEAPTAEQVAEAVEFIQRPFVDFPFDGEASKANALALMLTPFVQDIYRGTTPLFQVVATSPGAGKTKLTQTCLGPAMGEDIPQISMTSNVHETNKHMDGLLMRAPVALFLDNQPQDRQLDNSHLAGIVTEYPKRNLRPLGKSDTVSVPGNTVIVMSGNWIKNTEEIARRVCAIRLRKDTDLTDEENFQIPDLRTWNRENRIKMLQAIGTIVQSWLVAGRPGPDAKVRIPGFEEWSRVLGGILKNAGVPGFLANYKEERDSSDFDKVSRRQFYETWLYAIENSVAPVTGERMGHEELRAATIDWTRARASELVTLVEEHGIDIDFGRTTPAKFMATWLKSDIDKEVLPGKTLGVTSRGNVKRWYLADIKGAM